MPPGSLVYEPVSYVDRLDLARMFHTSQPLEVELGCGDGSFLVDWASRHPQRNFIGVERLLGRLRKVDRKARRAGLTNVRLIRLEASYFTEYLLPRGSVQALHLYFPDPWPKRKHWKHRLVNPHFAEVAGQALAPGGAIYVRTDSAEYFDQITALLNAKGQFSAVSTPAGLEAVLTDFERDFQALGVSTLHAAFERMPGSSD